MGTVMVVLALFHLAGEGLTPPFYAQFLQSARTVLAVFALSCPGGVFASLGGGRGR